MGNSIGVILAGGTGTRFNGNMPKQYMKLNGKEVIAYSIDAFRNSKSLNDFIAVVNDDEYEEKNIETKYGISCIKGGKTRNESIYNAINYIKNNFPDCEKVIFHDAARPFIKYDIIDNYIDLLNTNDAVITAVQITDSIGKLNEGPIDRSQYYLIQTPEAFKFRILLKYFSADSSITSIVQQMPKNLEVLRNHDLKFNLKITYPEDLFIAEQLIRLKYFKKDSETIEDKNLFDDKKALIFGGTGGVGTEIINRFKSLGVHFLAPSSKELDLYNITTKDIVEYCGDFKPDIIINAAAFSATDHDGLLDMFDKVFNINLKSNLVLIEYAKYLEKKVNIVLFSSSSSTRGRENITLYSAAKAGLNSIVESLAEKMSKHKIYINAIIPEKINTPMIQKLHKGSVKYRELLDVEDVIDAVLHCSIANTFGELIHIRKGL